MAIGTALLATQVGLGALQGIAGLVGAAKNKAPKYTMPTEYEQNLAEAQNRAAGGLPAASKQLATEQMARGTAAGLSKLQDRNSVATGVAALAQGEADQANRLAAMDAEARLRGEREVANARMAIANAKDKQFMIQQQDYLRRAQANANLLGGGIQNIVGGLQNYGMMDIMSKYYGGSKPEMTFGEKLGLEGMSSMESIGTNSPALGLPTELVGIGTGKLPDSFRASQRIPNIPMIMPNTPIGLSGGLRF